MTLRALFAFALILACCGSTLASASTSGDQWIEVSSDHFTVLTDAGEKQGRHTLDQFERMRWMFHILFPKANVDPSEPILAVAVKGNKEFQTLEPAAYLAKGSLQLAGLFQRTQDRNYILLRLDTQEAHPFAIIYHEYTHLQFSAASEWMPLWLDEGLAEFIQNTDIHDKDVQLGQPSVNDILYLRQNSLMPLATLFGVDHNSPYYHEEQKGSVFYSESWALTHYLMVNDRLNHTHRLDDYMALLRNHEDATVAAGKAFGNLKHLQSELASYISSGSYKQFILSSAAASLDEASYKVKVLPLTDADAIRADFLAAVDRKSDALTLIDSVLKTDPKNAQAYETKGHLALRDNDQDSARKWYGEAVQLNSQSYLAHYYYAAISIGRVSHEEDPQIEASLRAAIRLNPKFAPAYDELGVFFARNNKNLDEAHMLSLQAIGMEPANFGYRLNASTILMAMKRYPEALAVMRNASSVAKDPGQKAMLQNNMAAVQQMIDGDRQPKFKTETITEDSSVVTLNATPVIDAKPRHPLEEATGLKHEALGTIHHVECSSPAIMEFQLVTAKKAFALYSNNYFKLDLTALDFEPKGEMNPCKDIEGFKARVQYRELADKTVDGQVVSIELHK